MKASMFIAAFAVLCLAPTVFAQGPGPAPQKVTVMSGKVGMMNDFEPRRYTGRIVSLARVEVTVRVAGELMETGFSEGGDVKKGQLLYRLDDVKYAAAAKSAEALVAERKARLAYAQNNYNRVDELYRKSVSSKDAMESALSDLDVCKASLLSAEASLISANDDLANTRIYSPMDGKIGENAVAVGNYITAASGTLSTIVQLNPIRIRFSIANRDYLTIFGSEKAMRSDSTIRIRLADDSYYGLDGEVEFVSNEANSKTDTIQVFVKFDNTDGKLIPGSTVAVTLSKRSGAKKAAVVPSAVMYDADGAYVYVLDDKNTATRRGVILGNATASIQTIESGLEAGERIVTDGTHKVVPGSEVIAVDAQTAQ